MRAAASATDREAAGLTVHLLNFSPLSLPLVIRHRRRGRDGCFDMSCQRFTSSPVRFEPLEGRGCSHLDIHGAESPAHSAGCGGRQFSNGDRRRQSVAVLDTGINYNHPFLGGGFGPGQRWSADTTSSTKTTTRWTRTATAPKPPASSPLLRSILRVCITRDRAGREPAGAARRRGERSCARRPY